MKDKIQKLLEQETPDGKQALMILAEEIDIINEKINKIKRKIGA